MAETRYLKLKLSADLTADAKSNLLAIDALGAYTDRAEDGTLRLRSAEDVLIEPQSSDIGGTGQQGTVSFGTSAHSDITVDAYTLAFKIRSALSLVNAVSSTPEDPDFLKLAYSSATGSGDRTLSLDLLNVDKQLTVSDSGRIAVTDAAGSNANITQLTGLTTALSVDQGGTGYNGSENSATALNKLVPAYNPLTDAGKILSVKAGTEAELEWRSGGGGTITNVGIVVPNDLLTPVNSPLTGTGGTITLVKVPSTVGNTVYAGPNGTTGQAAFRLLVEADIPELAQSKITNLVSNLAAKEPTITAPNDATKFFNGQKQFVSPTKSDVGLGNVDNTSDADKPVSTATQDALNLKYDASNPDSFVDAGEAKAASVTNDIDSVDQTLAPDCAAVKGYVASSFSGSVATTTWDPLASATKSFNHGLDSLNVSVIVYDANNEQLFPDVVDIVDEDNIQLSASYFAGGSTTWRVIVKK